MLRRIKNEQRNNDFCYHIIYHINNWLLFSQKGLNMETRDALIFEALHSRLLVLYKTKMFESSFGNLTQYEKDLTDGYLQGILDANKEIKRVEDIALGREEEKLETL